ncbi:MAG: hypothetical protein JWM27_2878 [Gemmatimonadetes bacterium]|nr:hypothetical protein [Gemmatimonadota bacterium]
MLRSASKLLLPLLALALLALPGVAAAQASPNAGSAPAPQGAVLRGDVNGDGQVTILDAVAVIAYVVGKQLPSDYQVFPNADADGNGQITTMDALVIAGYATGRDVSRFPVGTAIQGVRTDGLLCTASIRSSTITCRTPQPQLPTGAHALILGGQHQYVTLTGTNIAFDGGTRTFSTDVTVQNLIPQPLGVEEADSSVSPIKIFFNSMNPSTVTVQNADSSMFLAPNQKYYQYAGGLADSAVSAPVHWSFHLPVGVEDFNFTVYVAASVHKPNGWIDVVPTPDTLSAGDSIHLSGTVRNPVGNVTGEPITWSSSNPSIATVDSATGWVHALADGTVTITAQAPVTNNPGNHRTGTATIVVSSPSAATTTITALPTSIAAGDSSVITVQVKRANGGNVHTGGATVVLSTTSGTLHAGASSGVSVTATDNGDGTYTARLIGSTAGSATVSGTLNGNAITSTAVVTITAGGAASLQKNSTDPQTATVATAVSAPPSVIVKDGFGNGVAGVVVKFKVTAGGGKVSDGTGPVDSVTVTSNGSGVATLASWTLGTAAGTSNNTLDVSATGAGAVTFTASATAGAATSMVKSAGDAQSATAGSAVATPPAVTVTDAHGNPVAGVSVTFAVASGGGSVTGGSATTNAAGVATVGSWTLGTTAGANTLDASSTGLTTVTFTATGTAGAPANMVKSAGDGQTATAGSAVATAPAVTVTDANGNPVSGVSVTFAVASGGGSVTGGSATTNASGVATVGSWTLGTTAGANTLDASSTGLTTVTFTATGAAGAAANMVKSAGDGQSATVNTSVSTAPAVTVTDANGNAVSGVSVTFAVASGGGSVTGGSATTNASGVATVGSWKLGTTAGSNTLNASSTGLTTVTFSATGTPDAPANIAKNAGDGQSATVNTAVSTAPRVLVTDQYGNPVPSVSVTFAPASGGGSVTGGTVSTNGSGLASVGSWKLGTTAGANSLTATAGVLSTTFSATATPDVPATITKTAGDLQTGTSGAAVAIAPAVHVVDQYNNAVPGVTITFTIAGGGGSRTVFTPTTDGSGNAAVGSWTLGSGPTTNQLSAAATPAGTSSPVTFTAYIPPVAGTDLLQAMGNTTLNIGNGQGVLTNDVTINGGSITVTSTNPTATVRGGSATVSADGSFTYLPAAGVTGRDSVQYTINDGHVSATGWLKFTFVGKVWYVENTFGGTATGRDVSPYTSVSGAEAVAGVNDTILVRTGSGTTAGGTLKNGQTLRGQGHNAAFTASLNGNTVTLLATGTQPVVGGLTLGSGNSLRGFRVLNGSGAGIVGASIGTLSIGELAVGATGGPALDVTTGTLTGNGGTGATVLDSLRSTNSTTTGVSLNGVAGTLTVNGLASSITSPTGAAVSINGSSPTFNFPGTISKTNGAGTGISLTSTGATVSFTGPSVVLSTGASNGINMSSATGTVSFVDSVKVTTTSGAGITASGGGTLAIGGTHNTISSGSGTALNVNGTTIGSGGLNFRSISASGGSNGVVLSSTGTTAGLTVTGDGVTNGSGGTIANSSGGDGASAGNGVYLSNTRSVNLSWMALSGHQNHAVYGNTVRDVNLNHVRITGNNGTSNSGTFQEGAVHVVNATGGMTVKNSRLDGSAYTSFLVEQLAGAPAADSIVAAFDTISTAQGSTADVRGNGLQTILTSGSANVRYRNNSVTYWWGTGIEVSVQNTAASSTALIQNNKVNQTSGALAAAGGIEVSGGALAFNISGNNITGTDGTAISVDRAQGNTLLNGTIDGNTIGTAGVANSGSATGTGIFVQHAGPSSTTVKISNNTIRQINGSQAIWALLGDDVGGGGSGTMNATITGNNIAEEGSAASARTGIIVQSGRVTGDTDVMCADVQANSITNFNNRIRPNERFLTTLRVRGYTGANNDNAAMQSYLTSLNAGTVNVASNNVSAGGPGYLNTSPAGSACAQPTL